MQREIHSDPKMQAVADEALARFKASAQRARAKAADNINPKPKPMSNLTQQPTPAETAARNYVLYNGLKFATEEAEQQVLAAHAFGYMRGQEESPAAQASWMSFAESKPMHNSVVLFCREQDQAVVVGIFLAFDEWNRPNMCVVGGGFNPMHRFSYWMPLPAAPDNPTTVSF